MISVSPLISACSPILSRSSITQMCSSLTSDLSLEGRKGRHCLWRLMIPPKHKLQFIITALLWPHESLINMLQWVQTLALIPGCLLRRRTRKKNAESRWRERRLFVPCRVSLRTTAQVAGTFGFTRTWKLESIMTAMWRL